MIINQNHQEQLFVYKKEIKMATKKQQEEAKKKADAAKRRSAAANWRMG